MDSRWIASTPNQGLRPVGAPGQRDYGLLVQILTQHLSEEHAALFAEPVPNPDGRTTDWYAPRDGVAAALDTLAPAARAEVEQRLAAALRRHPCAGRSPRPVAGAGRRPEGALLRAALEIPEPGFVRVVGGQPVLLAWAHLKDYPDAPKGVLGSWIRTRRPAPAAPPEPEAAAADAAAVPQRRATAAILPVIVERRAPDLTGGLALAAVCPARGDDRLPDADRLRRRLARRSRLAGLARALPAARGGYRERRPRPRAGAPTPARAGDRPAAAPARGRRGQLPPQPPPAAHAELPPPPPPPPPPEPRLRPHRRHHRRPRPRRRRRSRPSARSPSSTAAARRRAARPAR